MTLLKREKMRYARQREHLFGTAAEGSALFRGRDRDFCLPQERAGENLFRDIREEAIEYFRARGIRWHTGPLGGALPSNHLCSSQVCCVNFLFPLADRPEVLTRVLRRIYPDVDEALPIDSPDEKPLKDGGHRYVAFEWIGEHDYLHEGGRGKRARGANCTSADFLFRFRRTDGTVHVVLGEWKYTETYGRVDRAIPFTPRGGGTVRVHRYWDAFFDERGVFGHVATPELYLALFYEPLYQLMRLQLLAQEMERARELRAATVSVLHISPAANAELRSHAPAPFLNASHPGKGVLSSWQALVPSDKFRSLSAEELRSAIEEGAGMAAPDWVTYLTGRYGWAP